jgi:allantoate deiminase
MFGGENMLITSHQHQGCWIEERLCELADSTRTDGEIWRSAYTKEDAHAKELVKVWMAEAGLSVREDAVGNVFGRVQGNTPGTVLVGSHLDTVKSGGKYDGAAGVVSAIAAVGQLAKKYGKPEKTVEVVAFTEEEGSRFGTAFFGSMAVMGMLTNEDLQQKDAEGVTIEQAMELAGYMPGKLNDAKRDDIESYIELHVEQGPVLDQKGISIGIVESIVGCITHSITIKGMQNHAGTTPMRQRKDPVVAAARFIDRITSYAENESGTATLTIGKISALPGMANVIAKEVSLSIDLRDGNREKLLRINEFIHGAIKDIESNGYKVVVETPIYEMPVMLDAGLIGLLAQVTEETGISAIRMNSGAGHDAQIIAKTVPACMIFIPSKNGISHSSDEYTSAEDLTAGLVVLKGLIKKLAWGE